MAMTLKSSENSRFTDINDEPVDRLLSPIKGYENQPLLPLSQTIRSVANLFYEIDDYIFVALNNCQNPTDGLNQQESASIHLYTMQFHGGPSLYFLLNQSLRAENREALIPWFSYLKLFLTALYKLPSYNGIVWRGIKNVDLSSKYKKGTKFAWWGVSSCTTDIEVLKSNQFLGQNGLRSLFSIECINGKSISNHSYYKNKEKEIILMPGSYFEVIGQLDSGHELHIIQLREIPPPITLIKPPFSLSINVNASSKSISSKTKQLTIADIPINAKWRKYGITVAGGYMGGHRVNQLDFPMGIYVDEEETIYVADQGNHCIFEWKKGVTNGQIIAGGKGKGNRKDQLNYPMNVIIDDENNSLIISDYENNRVIRWPRRHGANGEIIASDVHSSGLAMDHNGYLYVSDTEKHEVRRWKIGEKNGILVAGGNGKGNRLDQFNTPSYIFVDQDQSVYVSDRYNHRIVKWKRDAKEGIVVAGGHNEGNSLAQLASPRGIIVDQLGTIYIADSGNDRIIRWLKGVANGNIVVGGSGPGPQANRLNNPVDLSFDRQNNLYVLDRGNHRVQRFLIDS